MNGGKLRIAAGQLASVTGDLEHNLKSLEAIAKKAADQNVDILVLPELFVSGYNAGAKFSSLAEKKDGSVFQRVSALASKLNIAICYGYPETDGQKIYNSAQFVSATGNSLANHRKTHLYGDYERNWFSEGDDYVCLIDYDGFVISTLICYEIEFPEPARANALNGANVILVLTATTEENNPQQVAQLMVRARAAENNLYAVYVNHARGEDGVNFNGNSLVAGPLGKVLARSYHGASDLIIADIQKSKIAEVNEINPYLSDVRRDLLARMPTDK